MCISNCARVRELGVDKSTVTVDPGPKTLLALEYAVFKVVVQLPEQPVTVVPEILTANATEPA